jgi:hypothetical protein
MDLLNLELYHLEVYPRQFYIMFDNTQVLSRKLNLETEGKEEGRKISLNRNRFLRTQNAKGSSAIIF